MHTDTYRDRVIRKRNFGDLALGDWRIEFVPAGPRARGARPRPGRAPRRTATAAPTATQGAGPGPTRPVALVAFLRDLKTGLPNETANAQPPTASNQNATRTTMRVAPPVSCAGPYARRHMVDHMVPPPDPTAHTNCAPPRGRSVRCPPNPNGTTFSHPPPATTCPGLFPSPT